MNVAGPSATPGAHLLIVDDEAAQLTALCQTLEDRGYVVAGFNSAVLALQRLREQRFELLLTDLKMPGMDGIHLLREAHGIDPDIVGVMMTGHGDISTAIDSMKAGALDYVLKPFKMSVLMPILERALDVRRLRIENSELQRRERLHLSQLEAANKELEAFSYSVSHDLRSPLRVMQGFAEVLAQDHAATLSAEARHCVDTIFENTTRMGQLITDLLRFSRLSHAPIEKCRIDMGALVASVLADLHAFQNVSGADIQVLPLPPVSADPSLLRQVLTNLLSNALKFTRQRSPAIIEVGGESREGECLYWVKDNGAGFDMRHASQLFGVFQRLHKPEQFEGTGIGLSIVQRIIERHGGRVWAQGAPEQGAVFFFTLPC